MTNSFENKKSIFAIIFLCLLASVGFTIAYFTSTSNIENIFSAGTYKTVTTEVFTSPSNWAPGDETPKTITTKNEGTIPVRVRVKLDESWTSKNEDDLPLTYNDENVAIINLDNEVDWIKNGDYYYYLHELAPGESTTSLIRSVTFNPNVPSDVSCSNSGGVYTCESTGNGYDGARYKLDITTETVQANEYVEIWENVPIMYDYVGDSPCTFDGELVPGSEYVNGQYTYRYRQEYSHAWLSTSDDGWGVRLTDLSSTDPVNTEVCTSINNKPIVSMNSMFFMSKATDIDLDNIDTSNVTNMNSMFAYSKVASIDLSNFDTSKVTKMYEMFRELTPQVIDLSSFDTSNVTTMKGMFFLNKATSLIIDNFDTSNVRDMSYMFTGSKATNLNLSNFDTSNVTNMSYMFRNTVADTLNLSSFDTSNVTNMNCMFYNSKTTILDLSSFDMGNVTNTNNMFEQAEATTGYARTQADAEKFNTSTDKPEGLIFTVKTS